MVSAEKVAVMTDVPDEAQRGTAKRKAAAALSIVKGETSAPEAARKHGVMIAEIERWSEQFFAAGANADPLPRLALERSEDLVLAR